MAQPTQKTQPVQITKVTKPKTPKGPYGIQDSNGTWYSSFGEPEVAEAWKYHQSKETVIIAYAPGQPKKDGSGVWNPTFKGAIVASSAPQSIGTESKPTGSSTVNMTAMTMILSYAKDLIVAGKLDVKDWAKTAVATYNYVTNPPSPEEELPVIDVEEAFGEVPPNKGVQFASKPGGVPQDDIDVNQIPF